MLQIGFSRCTILDNRSLIIERTLVQEYYAGMQVHQRTELPHIVKKCVLVGFFYCMKNIITMETHITEVPNTWTLDVTALASHLK
jgi:hypothetical protein